MLRILIADDHPRVRRCVRETLEDEEGWEVCGEAATGREAVSMTAELMPDVVVLDLSMPDVNGLDAARQIHKDFPDTEIFILSMHDAPEVTLAALASGARACLLKHDVSRLTHTMRRHLLRVSNTPMAKGSYPPEAAGEPAEDGPQQVNGAQPTRTD
jgi:DNA-binding NarL/FixJ family response regulator